MSLKSRFGDKWVLAADDSGCWLWTSTVTSKGYGSFWMNGGQRVAHRVSWLIYRGDIPDGLDVLHECDVKRCVNPDHLHLGTASENAMEAVERGLWGNKKGQSNGNSRLADNQITEIRQSTESYSKIAARYGIGKSQVGNIKKGLQWNHLQ